MPAFPRGEGRGRGRKYALYAIFNAPKKGVFYQVFSHKAVKMQFSSLRGRRSNLTLKTESPLICFRVSPRKEETNGPKETR